MRHATSRNLTKILSGAFLLCFSFDVSAEPSVWVDEIHRYYQLASRHYNTAHDLYTAGNLAEASVEADWAHTALTVADSLHTKLTAFLGENDGGQPPAIIAEWKEKISTLQTKIGALMQLLPAPAPPPAE